MGYSALKSTSERAEHFIGLIRTPIKPYLPAVSRFLIVATFYEDALRILWQWSDQVMYLELARFFPGYTAHMFLGFNAIVSRREKERERKKSSIKIYTSLCWCLLLVLF